MNQSELQDIAAIIRQAAQQFILPKYETVTPGIKDDGSLITEVDLRVQKHIKDALYRLYPDTDMLAEEMPATQQAELFANSSGMWCLDPLDGTRNFASGVPFFSISLALFVEGEIEMGLVYDPVRDECFSAIRQGGAFFNGKPLTIPACDYELAQTSAIVDFKRLPAELASKIATRPPYSSQRSFGSVALDWCYLAMGRCHLYLHGNQNLWDFAAGYLVFHEAAGPQRQLACTLTGEDVYNRTLAKRSAVVAVNESLFQQWTGFLSVKNWS